MSKPDDLANRAKEKITGMAKQGLAHPSTKPVLTGAAIGAAAGLILPIVSLPLGLAAGAGFAFWRRISR